MVTNVLFPENSFRLSLYLAAEEWLISKEGDWFFLWQSDPTVIYGRNQDPTVEVDMAACREKGVVLVRRKSGGGCVYSDRGNLMISYITDAHGVESCFAAYLNKVAGCLRGLGINAEVSGRNDILAGGLKISGNAFYLRGGRAVVHGTMMYDVKLDALAELLTPDRSKLQSKGVASVGARVANLKSLYSKLDLETIRQALVGEFCTSSHLLSACEFASIHAVEKTYTDPEWLAHGRVSIRHSDITHIFKGRVEGCGELSLELVCKEGAIVSAHLAGDYFTLRDGLDEWLSVSLHGVNVASLRFQEEKLREIDKFVLNLTSKKLLEAIV